MKHGTLTKRASLATIVIALACAAPAGAQAPIVDGYGGAGSVTGTVGGSGTPDTIAGLTQSGAQSGAPTAGSSQGAPDEALGTTGGGQIVTPRSASPGAARQDGASPVAASPGAGTPILAARAGGNELPFTGFDVALIAAGGLILLGIGFGARLLSRPAAVRPQAS